MIIYSLMDRLYTPTIKFIENLWRNSGVFQMGGAVLASHPRWFTREDFFYCISLLWKQNGISGKTGWVSLINHIFFQCFWHYWPHRWSSTHGKFQLKRSQSFFGSVDFSCDLQEPLFFDIVYHLTAEKAFRYFGLAWYQEEGIIGFCESAGYEECFEICHRWETFFRWSSAAAASNISLLLIPHPPTSNRDAKSLFLDDKSAWKISLSRDDVYSPPPSIQYSTKLVV